MDKKAIEEEKLKISTKCSHRKGKGIYVCVCACLRMVSQTKSGMVNINSKILKHDYSWP